MSSVSGSDSDDADPIRIVPSDVDSSSGSEGTAYVWYDSDSATDLNEQYDREYERPQDMWYPTVWFVNPRHRMTAQDRVRSREAGFDELYLASQPTTPREFRMRMRMFAIRVCRCDERRFPGNGDNLFWLYNYHEWFGDFVHLRNHEYLQVERNYQRTMLSFCRWKVLLHLSLRSYEFLFYQQHAILD